jgi:hypothetical protein
VDGIVKLTALFLGTALTWATVFPLVDALAVLLACGVLAPEGVAGVVGVPATSELAGLLTVGAAVSFPCPKRRSAKLATAKITPPLTAPSTKVRRVSLALCAMLCLCRGVNRVGTILDMGRVVSISFGPCFTLLGTPRKKLKRGTSMGYFSTEVFLKRRETSHLSTEGRPVLSGPQSSKVNQQKVKTMSEP